MRNPQISLNLKRLPSSYQLLELKPCQAASGDRNLHGCQGQGLLGRLPLGTPTIFRNAWSPAHNFSGVFLSHKLQPSRNQSAEDKHFDSKPSKTWKWLQISSTVKSAKKRNLHPFLPVNPPNRPRWKNGLKFQRRLQSGERLVIGTSKVHRGPSYDETTSILLKPTKAPMFKWLLEPVHRNL